MWADKLPRKVLRLLAWRYCLGVSVQFQPRVIVPALKPGREQFDEGSHCERCECAVCPDDLRINAYIAVPIFLLRELIRRKEAKTSHAGVSRQGHDHLSGDREGLCVHRSYIHANINIGNPKATRSRLKVDALLVAVDTSKKHVGVAIK